MCETANDWTCGCCCCCCCRRRRGKYWVRFLRCNDAVNITTLKITNPRRRVRCVDYVHRAKCVDSVWLRSRDFRFVFRVDTVPNSRPSSKLFSAAFNNSTTNKYSTYGPSSHTNKIFFGVLWFFLVFVVFHKSDLKDWKFAPSPNNEITFQPNERDAKTARRFLIGTVFISRIFFCLSNNRQHQQLAVEPFSEQW